jgi:hypothetical protein
MKGMMADFCSDAFESPFLQLDTLVIDPDRLLLLYYYGDADPSCNMADFCTDCVDPWSSATTRLASHGGSGRADLIKNPSVLRYEK